jgi:hypothetical protein
VAEDEFGFAQGGGFELAHDFLALEHRGHGVAKLILLIEHLRDFGPGLGADDGMRFFVFGESAENILGVGAVFFAAEEAAFE